MPEQKTARLVNKIELADLVGVTIPTITAWVKKGMPVHRVGNQGQAWQIDTAKALSWIVEHCPPDGMATGTAEAGELRRRKLAAETQKAELELQKAAAKIVSLVSAIEAWDQTKKTIQTLAQELPKQAAKAAAQAETEDEIAMALTNEIERYLTHLAQVIHRTE